MKVFAERLVAVALGRPYATTILAAVIFVVGIFALRSLHIEAYPELSDPQVRVITLFPGKGAEAE